MSPAAELKQIADNAFAWIGAGGDSNAGAIITPHGLLVIDSQQLPALAQQFRDALIERTGMPVMRLVNTHGHLDHIAGNAVFGGAPILAHAKTLAALHDGLGPLVDGVWRLDGFEETAKLLWGDNLLELVAPDDPKLDWFKARIGGPEYSGLTITPPTETFADQFEIVLPDDVVRLQYWGPAHSDGDIVVHLVRRKIIFVSDLMFYRRFPWMGDCDLNGWIERLSTILTLDVDTVIPGHGPPTDRAEVARFREIFVLLRKRVDEAIRRGASEAAAMSEVALPEFAHLPRYEEWLAINVKAAYRYLRGAR
ncbi:MBL fold metallo-hydrolase [Bosea thiooxidans]